MFNIQSHKTPPSPQAWQQQLQKLHGRWSTVGLACQGMEKNWSLIFILMDPDGSQWILIEKLLFFMSLDVLVDLVPFPSNYLAYIRVQAWKMAQELIRKSVEQLLGCPFPQFQCFCFRATCQCSASDLDCCEPAARGPNRTGMNYQNVLLISVDHFLAFLFPVSGVTCMVSVALNPLEVCFSLGCACNAMVIFCCLIRCRGTYSRPELRRPPYVHKIHHPHCCSNTSDQILNKASATAMTRLQLQKEEV